jgi:hypothetical protein
VTYIPGDESANGLAKVIYDSKNGKTSKTFDALDWLAQLVTHIPIKASNGFMGCETQTVSARQSAGGGPTPSSTTMITPRPIRTAT